MLRAKIEAVFDVAVARGLVHFNPARFVEIRAALGRHNGHVTTHHPAASWREVPAIVRGLREHEELQYAALEFAILTAVRSKEALGACWDEFDLGAKLWTVPASRMKGKLGNRRQHRVPLAPEAIALLERVAKFKRGPFVLTGRWSNQPLSETMLRHALRGSGVQTITVHGFRSAFRSFCADHAIVRREVAEACLSHHPGGTEGSYQRSDVVELRREVMARWARWCTRGR